MLEAEELLVAVESVLPALASVDDVEGAELVVSLEPEGAVALGSVPALGSVVAVEPVEPEPVDGAEPAPEGSEVGVDGAAVPSVGLVGVELVAGGLGAPGSVGCEGVWVPLPPVPVVALGGPEPGLAVGVEVAPPEVVGVLESGEDVVPAEVGVAALDDGGEATGAANGATTGAAPEPIACGAVRVGTEASILSRMVGGAAVR